MPPFKVLAKGAWSAHDEVHAAPTDSDMTLSLFIFVFESPHVEYASELNEINNTRQTYYKGRGQRKGDR